MLNTQFIWISYCSTDVCVLLLNTFCGLPAILLCLCSDGDVNIKVIFLIMGGEQDWRADLDLSFLLFIWKPNGHCQCVCSTSSCTLSHAVTIAPSLLALCNPVYTNTHVNALTEREYFSVWKCCEASNWILQCNLNSSLNFVLEDLHCCVHDFTFIQGSKLPSNSLQTGPGEPDESQGL